MVTTTAQKLGLVAFGLFLAFCVLETGLRLGGRIFLAVQEARNRASLQRGESIRVLCIGESTTALGDDQSYPSWLERILTARTHGVSFSVINKGIPSVTSDVLVRDLDAQLVQYRPHVVVAMMGINDPVEAAPQQPAAMWRVLATLRTWKLVTMLAERLRGALSGSETASAARLRDRRRLERRLVDHPNDVEALIDLGSLRIDEGEHALAEATLKRALETDPDNARAYAELVRLYRTRGEREEMLAAMRTGLGRYPIWNRRNAAALESGQATMLRTRQSYREVVRLVRQRGVRLVAVQYPMRSAALLRDVLGPEPDVLVVDNEEAFRDVLRRAPYGRYFSDQFAGDFGHTTPQGSRLLAGNVARVILEELYGQVVRDAGGVR